MKKDLFNVLIFIVAVIVCANYLGIQGFYDLNMRNGSTLLGVSGVVLIIEGVSHRVLTGRLGGGTFIFIGVVMTIIGLLGYALNELGR